MKRYLSLCLALLVSLAPITAPARANDDEKQAITQLTAEISLATG